MPLVTLTDHEMNQATYVGTERRRQQKSKGLKDAWGDPGENGPRNDIEGAAGEMAVAKYLHVYWNGNLGNPELPDVGPYQVRAGTKPFHKLLLHNEDEDCDIFILANGPAPNFKIIGWCYASEGKLQKYWSDPLGKRPAFFVPQGALHPITDLPREPLRVWLRNEPGLYRDSKPLADTGS